MLVLTENQFLALNGAVMISYPELHLNPSNLSYKIRNRYILAALADANERMNKRAELRKVYWQKVANGEIRPPTLREQLELSAKGDENFPSTHAARRALAKRDERRANQKI